MADLAHTHKLNRKTKPAMLKKNMAGYVEELTLYILQQNKRIDELEKQIKK